MTAKHVLQLELLIEPQAEGGFTVTCPSLPGLVTEGNTIDEVLANVPDAAKATLELYAERNLSPPDEIFVHASREPVTVKTTATVPV